MELTAREKIDEIQSSLVRHVSGCDFVRSDICGEHGLTAETLTNKGSNQLLVIGDTEGKGCYKSVNRRIRRQTCSDSPREVDQRKAIKTLKKAEAFMMIMVKGKSLLVAGKE